MLAILCDLDGTLCDLRHREHHVADPDNKDWDAFFAAMGEDTLVEPVAAILHAFADREDMRGAQDAVQEIGRETLDGWIADIEALPGRPTDHAAILSAHDLAWNLGKLLAPPLGGTWMERLKNDIPSTAYHIVIVTARPDVGENRRITEDWLQRHGIPYEAMYMRAAEDRRPDEIVKADLLAAILDHGYEPAFVLDDNQQVVEFWRSFGLICLQVAPTETRKRSQGEVLLDILVGPSGSGKSTYAAANYKPHQIVSLDTIRKNQFGDQEMGHRPEELAWAARYARDLIAANVKNGVVTCFDATNLKAKDRASVLRTVPPGALARFLLFQRRYEDKIATRGWRSEELISKHHRAFEKELPCLKAADDLGNVIVVDKREWKS